MPDRFDLVVIGAGPAGEKGAAQAAYFGKRVAIIERQAAPGGEAWVNAGIPSKTLRETALYITGFRQRDVYGVGLQLDPVTAALHLRTRTRHVVDTMSAAAAENIGRHGIELIHGSGRLGPDRTVLVDCADGSTRALEAEIVLITTGTRPFHPPGIPFHDPDVLDSETICLVEDAFSSIVVVGGGPVGCEFASIYAALGLEVTLVDNSSRLLPFMDGEITELLATNLRRTRPQAEAAQRRSPSP
jgi:NAD(P) transhydrogenase